MKVEITIDEACKEPKILIITDRITEEVSEVLKQLSENSSEKGKLLAGFCGDAAEVLEQSNIIRVYASGGKVFAVTEKGEYRLRLTLQEVEERLDQKIFVRISKSEIINLKKVKTFDLSFSGSIQVSLSNGTATYVSRRNVTKIKQMLGI